MEKAKPESNAFPASVKGQASIGKCYPDKDFRASHLYRIGLHLFKTTDFRCRRRLLIAAPSDLPSDRVDPSRIAESQALKQILESDNKDDDGDILFPGKKKYKAFMKDRLALRRDLDGIDDTKSWLVSKDRTPLEEQYLHRLREHQKFGVIGGREMINKEPNREYSYSTTTSESTSVPSGRECKSWSMKEPVGFFKQYKDSWRTQAMKEFEEFIEYCKQNGIAVDFDLAKAALLPPPDGEGAFLNLRGPKCPFTIYSEMASDEKRDLFRSRKEIQRPVRQPKKPKPSKTILSTGSCEVGVLVDTWLQFKQFKEMSRLYHRSRTDPSKFWPGEGLHSRRVSEMEPHKSNTENAIFYPVDLRRRQNNSQVVSWQDNEAGYVQVGQASRKCYHL